MNVNILSFILLTIWYVIDYFMNQEKFEFHFFTLIFWLFLGIIINIPKFLQVIPKINYDEINLTKNFSYKLLTPLIAHTISLLLR